MAYLGTPIDTRNQFQSLQGKRFNGDGSTTDFTLDVAPSSTLDYLEQHYRLLVLLLAAQTIFMLFIKLKLWELLIRVQILLE
jgi:hypothetical protein